MTWLQENWIIALVGLVVAVVLLWWRFGRARPTGPALPTAEPPKPAKPLEPVKPEIVAAEAARFKPIEPRPRPVPPPVAEPAIEAAAIPAEPTVPPPPAPAPTAAKADNLQLLKGVGPKLGALLNGLGITRFQQIADWTDADVARIDAQLGAFQGRIARDNLIDQASYLARGDKAGFEAKYGALGGEP